MCLLYVPSKISKKNKKQVVIVNNSFVLCEGLLFSNEG